MRTTHETASQMTNEFEMWGRQRLAQMLSNEAQGMVLLSDDFAVRDKKGETMATIIGVEITGDEVSLLLANNDELSWWEVDLGVMQNLCKAVLYEIKKQKIEEVRNELRDCIKGLCGLGKSYRFTKSEAVRIHFDGGWREITGMDIPSEWEHDIMVGWHDERCSGKGINARVGMSAMNTEKVLELYGLALKKANTLD